MTGPTEERYRLIRLLGEGGMGRVHEALHCRTGRVVALKVLADAAVGTRGDAQLARFAREARAAGHLRTPHVVQIIDAGTDPHLGAAFIAMELLRGRDVQKAVDALGPLDPRAALAIAVQACTGLVAAHAAGVLHRDIKAANLFLAEQDEGRIEVKLLDFGIAKLLHDPNADRDDGMTTSAALTQTGSWLGSPMYMSPEQALDIRSVDARSDVFSLGVVLYQMLAGRPPHGQHTSFARLVLAITQEPAKPLGAVAPWVTPSLAALVARALAIPREARFASAAALLEALRSELGDEARLHGSDIVGVAPGLRTSAPSPLAVSLAHAAMPPASGQDASARSASPTPSRSTSRISSRAKSYLVAAVAVVMASVGLGAFAARSRNGHAAVAGVPDAVLSGAASDAATARAGDASATPAVRRSVAVVGFRNLGATARDAWLGTALIEMLTAELAAGSTLRAIPGERVARARRELTLADDALDDPGSIGRVHENLGSDLVVAGAYLVAGGGGETGATGASMRVQLTVYDGATSEAMATVARAGNASDVLALVAALGAELREKLGVRALSPIENGQVRAALPSSPEALRLYASGIEENRHYHFKQACALLEAAVDDAPTFALGHAALGRARISEGHEEAGLVAARRAVELEAGLSREDRLWVEASLHDAEHQWERAAETFRALLTFFPDNVDYGIALAQVQSFGGKPLDALGTIAELRRLPPALSSDPRIDFEEVRAAYSSSSYARVREVATRAIDAARARQNRFLVTQIQYFNGSALVATGEVDAGVRALEEAQRESVLLDDKREESILDLALAGVNASQGDLALARRRLERAEGALAGLAVPNYQASVKDHLAGVEIDEGDLPRARAHIEEAIAIYRTIQKRHGLSGALPIRAHLEVLGGDLDHAVKDAEETIAIARVSGRKSVEVRALLVLADVAARRRDEAGAQDAVARALALATEMHDRSLAADARQVQGDGERRRGEASARATLEGVLADRRALGEVLAVAETELSLAEIAVADGRAADAERFATDASNVATRAGARPLSARAAAVRAAAARRLVDASTR